MKPIIQALCCAVLLLMTTTGLAPENPEANATGISGYNLKVSDPRVLSEDDIARYAEQLNFFDPKLIVAIATVESELQPKVKSVHKGVTYYGLMQVSYGTAQMVGFKGRPADLLNWRTNVKVAAKYLEVLHDEHGSKEKAVAAYNAGTVIPCSKCKDHTKVVNQRYVDKVAKAYKQINTKEI